MNALVFEGPRQMALMPRPDPTPEAGETLIDVLGTGICGSDLHGYTGSTGRRFAGQIMGHETVGRVRRHGPNTDGPSPGTLVTFNPLISCRRCEHCRIGATNACEKHRVIGVDPALDGSFADSIVVPVGNVVSLSDSIPPLHGTLVEPLAVGYNALDRATATPDDRVLIVGGGPIGQACALATRRLGIGRVLVSEIVEDRRTLLGKLGFETTPPDLLTDRIDEVLGGPATKVIDAVGIDASLEDAFDHSTRRSVIVLVGMGARRLSLPAYSISVGERTLVGSYCYTEDNFRSTADWVSAGQDALDVLIDTTVPLAEGAEAFRSLAEGTSFSNKIVLTSEQAA